jgi:general stress protein 26
MSDHTPVTHDLTQLFEKIKDVRIAMLTSFDDKHQLHSRPMGTIKPDADGSLLFLTDKEHALVAEVQKDSQVGLTYSDPGQNIYVSVTGHAQVYRDQAKIDELWNESFKAWFPKGKGDPNITILKVEIQQAEYWDTPSSFLSVAYGYVRALVTGEKSEDNDVNQHAQVQR